MDNQEYLDTENDEVEIVYKNNHNWKDIPKNPNRVCSTDANFIWWLEQNRTDIENTWNDVVSVINDCGENLVVDENKAYVMWCITMYNMRSKR